MPPTKSVVSAILYKRVLGELQFFTQIRWKPEVSPQYSGMIEIPAGIIDPYENVYDALHREIKEETNLDIVRIVDNYRGDTVYTRENDSAFVFKPFVCQQVLETNDGLPWIGFVFLCEVTGEVIIQESEAKDPKWLSFSELEEMLERKETVFILQYPVLQHFVSEYKTGNILL